MSRKRKARNFFNARNVLFIHFVVYILAIATYWYALVAAFSYPGNALVPRSVFEALRVERLSFTLIWGLIFLIHFVALFGYRMFQQYQIQKAYGLDDDGMETGRFEERDVDSIDYQTAWQTYQEEQQNRDQST